MGRASQDELLLGEWACLGILYPAPSHGFAIATRLRPDGDIGRVWSLSRALTYRSLDQLAIRGLIQPIGEERGIAGGNRTVLAATRSGRAQLRKWLSMPVPHLRDVRSALLLKVVLADWCEIDVSTMLERQHVHVASLAAAMAADAESEPNDVVRMWRRETSDAALRFLGRLIATRR